MEIEFNLANVLHDVLNIIEWNRLEGETKQAHAIDDVKFKFPAYILLLTYKVFR